MKNKSPFSYFWLQSSQDQDQTNGVILLIVLENYIVALILIDLFFTFGVFSCFTMLCLVVILVQSTIHVISIFLLCIGQILIIMVLFFGQRLLWNLGIMNRTADLYNLWIESAFEKKCFIQYFILCDIFCGKFGFC